MGQVGGVVFFPFFDADSCLVASLPRTCEPFPEELAKRWVGGAEEMDLILHL